MKFSTFFKKVWQGLAVYFATLIGVLLSQYAPLLLEHGAITATFQWIRLAISVMVSLYIVGTDESRGDEVGKKQNLRRRIANAFAHGIAWSALVGIAGQAAGA